MSNDREIGYRVLNTVSSERKMRPIQDNKAILCKSEMEIAMQINRQLKNETIFLIKNKDLKVKLLISTAQIYWQEKRYQPAKPQAGH